MKRLGLLCLLILCVAGVNVAAQARLTIQELMKVRRVGDPQISPDGKKVAFTVGDVNKEANRTITQIYVVSIDGGEVRQLTRVEGSNSVPRWSPDGKKIAFNHAGQIWTMDADDGGDRKQITKLATGASGAVWSPNGKMIAFVTDVFPECNGDEACNKREEDKVNNSKVQAKVTDRLLYRHWTEWRDRKRTHVFMVDAEGEKPARELTSGDWDAPPYGASSWADYAFSPDSSEILYLRNPDKVEAVSTNSDIYAAALSGGAAQNITIKNGGYDASPVYSRNGRYIFFRSQATPMFEADRWRIMVYDRNTRQTRELTAGFDLQVEDFAVAPDNSMIYFTAGERARANIFALPMNGGKPKRLGEIGYVTDLKLTPDGKTLVYTRSDGRTPPEIGRMSVDGTGIGMLTRTNDEMMKQFGLLKVEDFEWTGAANTKVHGLITKPANFDPNKKYPLFVLIHGGPQSASNDGWSYRWNAQVFANAGYIVFAPNPRGSTGYGQKFVNDISGDWGGKVFVDIQNGVADLIAKNKYIDRERIGAGGASYGGYMVNWILGHNDDKRFKYKALLCHAGVYNLESMAGVTEELWFTNWEFKGTPQTNPQMYAKWSPHKHSAKFKTPTLVTHGEIDYRVPIGEGLQLYTALQLNNVESKLVYFPDEGHWILKPQNSEFWYGQVLDWFGKHLQP